MKPFRVLVVGCGQMCHAWVKYAKNSSHCEIVGLVDIHLEKAENVRIRYGLDCPTDSDFGRLLEKTKANLVFDITPPECHRDVVVTALRAGCDVFAEKPMAATMEQGREMVKVAEETNRTYAVMQNRRYVNNLRSLKSFLDAGTIGQPTFVAADFFLGPYMEGFRKTMASPLLLDMAIHTFDQARFLIGGDPISVRCHEFNPQGSWYEGNAAATCTFEFDNGVVFSYRGCWCAKGFPTSWESSWRVVCTRGTVLWDGKGSPQAQVAIPFDQPVDLTTEVAPVEVPATSAGREGHEGCLDALFASLRSGRTPETDCRDNIKSLAMVFGAIESARSGQVVDLRALGVGT